MQIRNVNRLAGVAILTVLTLCAEYSPSYAIQIGSANDYPLGVLMGTPSGATPPDGVYLTDRFSFGTSNPVNQTGQSTGSHTTIVGSSLTLFFVPGVNVLGARYSAAIIGVGFLDVQLTLPHSRGGATYNKIGAPDTLFIPINLSWNLGHSIFLGGDLGFEPPIGTYSSTDVVNTGNNRWAFNPDAGISYLGHGYDLTVHLDYEINFVNPQTHYTSGNTVDIDWTATKKFGRWEFGPVGYWYKQVTADSGPAALNGGQPLEASAGFLGGYNFGPVTGQLMYVHDYLARAAGYQGLWRGDISVRF